MRKLTILTCTLALLITSCSADDQTNNELAAASAESGQKAERGGTITVGGETWTIVPQFCQIHNKDLVNISGHAEGDPSLEISIDFGGPNQVVVGGGNRVLWRAMNGTIKIQVEGRRVQGTASFNKGFASGGNSAEGSFDVIC